MTLRDLLQAREAAESAAWDHTAELLAMTVNVNRGKGKSPISSNAIHPYRRRRGQREETIPGTVQDLKVFLKPRKKRNHASDAGRNSSG